MANQSTPHSQELLRKKKAAIRKKRAAQARQQRLTEAKAGKKSKKNQDFQTSKRKPAGKTATRKAAGKSVKRKKQPLTKRQRFYRKYKRKIKRFFRRNKLVRVLGEILLACLIFMACLVIIAQFTFTIPKMEGFGMTPTISNNSRLFVSKIGELSRFDIIYFRNPKTNDLTVRRIIGIPGDTVEYQQDKLFINNQERAENYILKEINNSKQNGYQFTQDFNLRQLGLAEQVPKDKYFVLGDNRTYASDSRFFGYVDKKDIIGIVEMTVLPINEMERY